MFTALYALEDVEHVNADNRIDFISKWVLFSEFKTFEADWIILMFQWQQLRNCRRLPHGGYPVFIVSRTSSRVWFWKDPNLYWTESVRCYLLHSWWNRTRISTWLIVAHWARVISRRVHFTDQCKRSGMASMEPDSVRGTAVCVTKVGLFDSINRLLIPKTPVELWKKMSQLCSIYESTCWLNVWSVHRPHIRVPESTNMPWATSTSKQHKHIRIDQQKFLVLPRRPLIDEAVACPIVHAN